MKLNDKEIREGIEIDQEAEPHKDASLIAPIVEEITIEELAVDGICGVY